MFKNPDNLKPGDRVAIRFNDELLGVSSTGVVDHLNSLNQVYFVPDRGAPIYIAPDELVRSDAPRPETKTSAPNVVVRPIDAGELFAELRALLLAADDAIDKMPICKERDALIQAVHNARKIARA